MLRGRMLVKSPAQQKRKKKLGNIVLLNGQSMVSAEVFTTSTLFMMG